MKRFEFTLNEATLAQLIGVSIEEVLIQNATVLRQGEVHLEVFTHDPAGEILMDKLGLKLENESA